jgi:hypothetical protein
MATLGSISNGITCGVKAVNDYAQGPKFLMHLVRIINGWSVAIGPHNIPMSASWVALVVSAPLALWGVVQIG